MLKIKKNLLVGTIIVGSLFSNDSIGVEKERRNAERTPETKPKVRFFVSNSKELSLKREEKKPKMEKAPDLSEPQTLKSSGALWRLLRRARDLSNRGKQLIKLGELKLNIPKKHHQEAAAQCVNDDHISALEIPSYLIMRNFIQEPNGKKTTVRRDLETDSMADIHDWLSRIAGSSKPRGADTPYNILSIHNATQEQADEILKAPITHLGGIRIWLRPTSSEAGLPTPNEEKDKKLPQTIEKREGYSVKSDSEVSVQSVPVILSVGKKDEKALATKEEGSLYHSVDSPKKELSPQREEKKPKMEKAPAWGEPQTLKSTGDLRKLLRQVKALSKREKQLVKLGELMLDIPKEHYEEVAAQCANNDHISALEIPSYLIVRNFMQEPNGRKTTVRRDLENGSIAEIHEWLNRIAGASKSRGADTPYNVLSIHNATQEQADEILKAPTISHLGAIRIWLRPASSEAKLSLPNEGQDKKPPQTIEEWEGHSVKGGEEAVITKEEDVVHHPAAVDENQKGVRGASDASPLADVLDGIEALPLYPDPIPELILDLVLLRVELLPDLKNKKEDETKRFARDLHQAKFKSTLMEIANRKIALHHITKKQSDDSLPDENADDIENLEGEYQEWEVNGEGENVNVLDEQLYQHLDDQLLKKREAPVLEELAQSLEEHAFFEIEKEQNGKVSQGYEGAHILLNWDITPLTKGIELNDLSPKTDIEAKKPKDPVFPQVRHTSNLVQLYCRSYRR
jgi:hypothetical protein